MNSTKPTVGRRMLTGFSRLLITLLVLGLLGLVAWLASERNARTYSLRLENGKLVVLKGRMLPIGADPWTPGDPMLADTYAPIPLEGTHPDTTLLQAKYADREELDRALFRLLEELAAPRIHSENEQMLEQGLYFLRRAQRLTGISQEQRLSLEQMQADVAFYQARLKLEQARRMVADAITQLELASNTQGPNADRARQLVTTVNGPARALEQALREASRTAPAPAAPQPGTPAGQTPPTDGGSAAEPTGPAPGSP